MAYPFLPVNPCCTDVVINSPCGCGSTIGNCSCNNNSCGTNLTASSTIVYDGPALTCTTAEPCDTLNVILEKIDQIICNLLTQINILTNQVTNITTQIITINGDIINIYNQLAVCCTTTTSTSSSSTTTSTTTIHPCENFSLNNTGVTPVAIIITDCNTGEPEAIILNPGDTNICVVTDSPLTVPGTIIVTPNGPCLPPTSSTTSTTSTSTSSTSSTTTTTTTAIPCECLTFYNSDDSSHLISYKDCSNTSIENVTILANQTINVCGSQGFASDSYVLITIGADCVGGLCPTTTTTTTLCQDCIPVSFTNPDTGNGVTTLPNGLVITTTYVGPSIVSPGPRNDFVNCGGFPMSGNSILPGQIDGPFTLTISFSVPVNNIYIGNSAMGYNLYPGQQECFTVNSNQGTPTLTLAGGCYDYGPVGNQVCGSYQGGNTGGNIQVSTSTPYTELTITGNGIGNLVGYSFDLCFPSCPTTTTTTTCANCILPDVIIGSQTWTGCNLDITTYQNGDPIPQVQDATAWGALTTGAWCYYNNDINNGCTYGKMYNAYAVNDPRGLAPIGYHIPSEAELSILISYAGGTSIAGGALKETGFTHWISPNAGATDTYGFRALGSGYRDGFGSFNNINDQGYFWTTDYPLNSTVLSYNNSSMPVGLNNEKYGLSVRLVKDEF